MTARRPVNARRLLLATAASALVAATIAPAAEAGDNFLTRVAPSKNGAYSQEIQEAEVAVGATENFFFRVRSQIAQTHRVRFEDFTDEANPPGFKIRWFTDDGENITDAVKDEGQRFRLKGGAAEFIEMRAKAVESGGCLCHRPRRRP